MCVCVCGGGGGGGEERRTTTTTIKLKLNKKHSKLKREIFCPETSEPVRIY